MKIDQIILYISNKYAGLSINKNWGERGLFYNPGGVLPLGAYMMTFKESDGANDFSSHINRGGHFFRLNLKISQPSFLALFGAIPKRPPAGGIVVTGHDFTELDAILPHPVYGWMSWIGVLNPTLKTIDYMIEKGYFDEAYNAAIAIFEKKTNKKLLRA